MSILKVEEIHTYYGRSYVLQGVSLNVDDNEIVALLGRNGAGKTTTLKSIIGLVKPKSGNIIFNDSDITSLPTFRVARSGLGYVPQGRQLFSKMTVLENLKSAMEDKSDEDLLEETFQLFPVLKERLNQVSGTLSGGEQQALAISRALVTKPKMLLLDEPTTGLMPIFVEKLKEVIAKLRQNGLAILIVEEKIPFALSLADRVYFMVKGSIAHEDAKEKLLGEKDIFVRYLGVEV